MRTVIPPAGAVFAAGAATMAFELLVPRRMAPWLGTALPVWTATFAVVLAGLAIGSAIGGRLADRARARAEAVVFLLAAVGVAAAPLLAGLAGGAAVDEGGLRGADGALVVAGAAAFLPLLLDSNQLPQVSQGTHPEGAAASALEHLVGDAKTIEADRGLLLGTTYRMHPQVNEFVSDAFYEGRLVTAPANALQHIGDGLPVGGTGIRHIPIRHEGASSRSREEAEWIAEAIASLRGRHWIDERGAERPLDVEDVLVVAPYNAQVAEIARAVKARLHVDANVGTVDKFQGREAPVAIYSMTTSSPEDAPRDLEFLYSGNRLNVAVSRARGLAIVVANPALLGVACRTPEQMRLVNAFCRLLEVAEAQRPGPMPAVEVGHPGRDDGGELLLFPDLLPPA